jgi:hypothetical protein
MTRQRKAQIATIAVLVAVVGVVAVRRTGQTPRRGSTPQDAIYAMLDAAREGNVRRYLTYYSDQMQASLKQTIAESSDFSKYLRDSNAPIKGIAINEPEKLTETEVKARVEYVYQDRNEIQYLYLQKAGGDWRITRMDSAERIKTTIPYGTPVE